MSHLFQKDAAMNECWKNDVPEQDTFTPLDSFRAYANYLADCRVLRDGQRAVERALMSIGEAFELDGICWVCGERRRFHVDYQYAYAVEGVMTPNWRERLVCSGCGLNNRIRAAIHLFHASCRPRKHSRLYITEQTTPLYHRLRKDFGGVTGSEYLGQKVSLGAVDPNGLLNEDVTRLSFQDAAFDFILSFDVLEHVPAYRDALAEARRCLRPGGVFLFSAPFRPDCRENIVRARLSSNGELTHLMTPEYHADPIKEGGCLCYYHFGWQLLEDVKAAGFIDVMAFLYWSRRLGYLGPDQLLFRAAVPAETNFQAP